MNAPRRLLAGRVAGAAIVAVLALTMPADASRPVARTLSGCVTDGVFISSDGYRIDARSSNGRRYDLSRFEGRKLSMAGSLLPGDRFYVKQPPRDLGRCGP